LRKKAEGREETGWRIEFMSGTSSHRIYAGFQQRNPRPSTFGIIHERDQDELSLRCMKNESAQDLTQTNWVVRTT